MSDKDDEVCLKCPECGALIESGTIFNHLGDGCQSRQGVEYRRRRSFGKLMAKVLDGDSEAKQEISQNYPDLLKKWEDEMAIESGQPLENDK